MAARPTSQSPGTSQQPPAATISEYVNYKKKYKALKRKMKMLVYVSTINYPMFVYVIRFYIYPESVVSHVDVHVGYDRLTVGTKPYPVNKHGIP